MISDLEEALILELGKDVTTWPKSYIGDGVYAFYDGYAVVLCTQRRTGLHWLTLEPVEFEALKTFLKRAREGQ